MKISLNLPNAGLPVSNLNLALNSKSTVSVAAGKSNFNESETAISESDLCGGVTYRKKIFISNSQRCKEKKTGKILINVGEDKVLSATFNGQEIQLSQSRPSFMQVWNLPSEYSFDQDLVKWDDENLLEIHLADPMGGGGIY